jgi:hypothetical protein
MTVPMDDSSDKAAAALARIATFIRGLSPNQVDGLVSGEMRLALVDRDELIRSRSHRLQATLPDPEPIRQTLSRLMSREEGGAYLSSLELTKPSLERLAAAFDLPVRKTDTVERLKDRIVEATIGYRLRSEAVRGEEATEWHKEP